MVSRRSGVNLILFNKQCVSWKMLPTEQYLGIGSTTVCYKRKIWTNDGFIRVLKEGFRNLFIVSAYLTFLLQLYYDTYWNRNPLFKNRVSHIPTVCSKNYQEGPIWNPTRSENNWNGCFFLSLVTSPVIIPQIVIWSQLAATWCMFELL